MRNPSPSAHRHARRASQPRQPLSLAAILQGATRRPVRGALRHAALAAVLALGTSLLAGPAHGELPPASPAASPSVVSEPAKPVKPGRGLNLAAAPLLGSEAQTQSGWFGYLVQIENPLPQAFAGELYVAENPQPWVTARPTLSNAFLKTSFAVDAGQTVTLELPVHGYQGHEVRIVATAEDGTVLGQTTASHSTAGDAMLFDLSTPSRIAKGLTGSTVTVSSGGGSGPPTAMTLAASTPATDAVSGEQLLPTYAAGYAGATLVLAESEGLNQLNDARQIALAGWVLAGGTLAVAVTRPEDLRSGALPRFAGGELTQVEVPRSVSTIATSYVPSDSAPIGSGTLDMKTSIAREEIRKELVGYEGGNLEPTAWGAVASYGLGQVHLLAFDPNRAPFLGDTWSEFKLRGLIEHALARRSLTVSPFAVQDPSDWRSREVRRSLDPNVGNHWVIVFSAVLLIAYAIVAGPVNFQWAGRAGTPLKALRRLPVLSLIAFMAILLLGWVSKGGRSRARHLTLVEAGAGMGRATAVRYRAFYAASNDNLSIGVAEQGHVLDLVNAEGQQQRTLHVDRSGFRIEDVASRPWETLLVREDGFINVGQGVAMQERGDDLLVTNRTGRDLAAALVMRPDGTLFLHQKIKDREAVLASEGQRQTGVTRSATPPRPLPLWQLNTELDTIAPGLGTALEAWNTMTDAGDWWPDNTPVLIAQWVGGEGVLMDSGYRIDSDRVVIRVVGFGGQP